MLRSLTEVETYTIGATDGAIGSEKSQEGIYRHYQREGYWHDQKGREAA
jgi:hypothetical protein